MTVLNLPTAAEQRQRAEDEAYKAKRREQFAKLDAKNRPMHKPQTGDRTRPVPWKGYEGLVKEMKR